MSFYLSKLHLLNPVSHLWYLFFLIISISAGLPCSLIKFSSQHFWLVFLKLFLADFLSHAAGFMSLSWLPHFPHSSCLLPLWSCTFRSWILFLHFNHSSITRFIDGRIVISWTYHVCLAFSRLCVCFCVAICVSSVFGYFFWMYLGIFLVSNWLWRNHYHH